MKSAKIRKNGPESHRLHSHSVDKSIGLGCDRIIVLTTSPVSIRQRAITINCGMIILFRMEQMMQISLARLFFFGLSLGLRNLVRQGGSFRRQCGARKLIARIFHPVDYWRYAEIGLVLGRLGSHLPTDAPVRLLELAGPKISALLLSDRFAQAEVVSLDVMADDLKEWHLMKSQLPDRGRRIRLLAADGRGLPFPGDAFDAAVSVCAIEHFQGRGDVEASRELARCTRPGGTVLLTLPVASEYSETWLEEDVYGRKYEGEPIFWQRRYDAQSIEERIIRPGGWRLAERIYVGERWVPFERASRRVLGSALFEALGLLHPLAAAAFIVSSPEIEYFQEPGRHLSFVFLALEKPVP